MDIKLRPGTPEDADECGRIWYEAFSTLAMAHGFPPDFPLPKATTGLKP